MQTTAPSFADLSSKMVNYVRRNANLSELKVWTTMQMVYGEYIQELGWDLDTFRKEIFPAVYEEAKLLNKY